MILRRIVRIFVLVFVIMNLAPGEGITSTSPKLPASQARKTLEINQMTVDDRIFTDVRLGTSQAIACSPKDPGPNWRGILVNSPKSAAYVRSKGFGPLPICGLYTLDLVKLLDGQPMRIVVRDVVKNISYEGAIVAYDPSPDAPDPDATAPDPAALAGIATSSYFNQDLFQYVKLPQEPAIYELYVVYGGVKSNVLRVQVTEGKAAE